MTHTHAHTHTRTHTHSHTRLICTATQYTCALGAYCPPPYHKPTANEVLQLSLRGQRAHTLSLYAPLPQTNSQQGPSIESSWAKSAYTLCPPPYHTPTKSQQSPSIESSWALSVRLPITPPHQQPYEVPQLSLVRTLSPPPYHMPTNSIRGPSIESSCASVSASLYHPPTQSHEVV
jgi:hypothetical protein